MSCDCVQVIYVLRVCSLVLSSVQYHEHTMKYAIDYRIRGAKNTRRQLLSKIKVPIFSYIDNSRPELALHCWQLVGKTNVYGLSQDE